MKIENIEVYGFRRALFGMRNPFESWHKSDSKFASYYIDRLDYININHKVWNGNIDVPELPFIGPEDMKLACKLIKAGPEHRKFMRQIMIWFDITIPIYVWSEKDTYCIGKVRNSCSTMHTLGLRDLAQNDFELPIKNETLDDLNALGVQFREARLIKDTAAKNEIRRKYKNALPSGFLQKSTYMMSYELALSMYFQRRNHRLPEWNENNPNSICSFILTLPYMKEFVEAKEG